MKKKSPYLNLITIYCFVIIFCFVCNVNVTVAQENETLNKNKNIQQKGNFIVQGNLGFSFNSYFKNSIILNSPYYVNKYLITGITTEFILVEGNIPFGISAEIGYDYYSFNVNYTNSFSLITTKFSSITDVFRLLLRPHIHLIKSEKLDLYLLGGIGTRVATSYLSDGRVLSKVPLYPIIPAQLSTSSIILKAGIGFRYFPHKHFGLHAEVALGTPFLQAGICYKFK